MSRSRRQNFRAGTRQDVRSDNVDSSLRLWHKGDPLTADRLTRMVQAINRTTAVAQARQQSREIVTSTFKAEVLEEFDNYLLVARVDGFTSGISAGVGGSILVAKPWLLRRIQYDNLERHGVRHYDNDRFGEKESATGKRYAQFADAAESESSWRETQWITPAYLQYDLIFVSLVENGTGVFYTSSNGQTMPINLIDMNVDGRSWAAQVHPRPGAEMAVPDA